MSAVCKLYALGGTGMNLGSRFEQWRNKTTPGFTRFDIAYLDTSTSNVTDVMPAESIYLVKNLAGTEQLKGSGKRRSKNYDAIEAAMPEFMHEHPPGEMNIILHGLSGGSGNVAGNLIAGELASRGIPFVVVAVGSTASGEEVRNMVDTLESYDALAQDMGQIVPVMMRENIPTIARSQVDNDIINNITIMSALFSGDNRELDAEDVANFLLAHRKHTPRLACFDLFEKEIILEKGQSLLSLMTLTDEDTPSVSNVSVEYQGTGFLHENAKKANTKLALPIHAGIIGGYYVPLLDRLKKMEKQFEDNKALVNDRPIVQDSKPRTKRSVVLRD